MTLIVLFGQGFPFVAIVYLFGIIFFSIRRFAH